ncbi:MAG: hypothetical protein D6701_12010 [Gemmatimonadetes bacterium]|nr:MAG: hypothetical protein D6701_12010 [Gemmatimonadota bacterium]
MLTKVVLAIAALLLGIYLGMGRFSQTPEEIEQLLGRGQRRKAKRHFMWLDYLKPTQRASARRARPSRFRTAAPRISEPDAEGDGPPASGAEGAPRPGDDPAG